MRFHRNEGDRGGASVRSAGLIELSRTLLSAESTEAVAEAGVRRIREIIPCHHISLVVYDFEAHQATVLAAYAEGQTKEAGGSRWRLEAFGPRSALRTPTVAVIDDLSLRQKLPPALVTLSREGIRSLLVLPLTVSDDVIGAVYLGSNNPGAFSVHDVSAAAGAADFLALALAGARRQETLLRHAVELERQVSELVRSGRDHRGLLAQVTLAQEQERQRIAEDLHDDSVQVMTTAALRLQALKAELIEPRQLDRVRELQETVTLAIRRLRHLMFELVPPSIDSDGLASVLLLYLERMKDWSGVAYRLRSRLSTQPPAETRAILYRIVQEALTNVVKHAGAGSVEVALEERDGGYLARISDDGAGFTAPGVREDLRGHLGLTVMRQRAEMAGGWCRVRSVKGDGTTVEAWVPGEETISLPEDTEETAATSA